MCVYMSVMSNLIRLQHLAIHFQAVCIRRMCFGPKISLFLLHRLLTLVYHVVYMYVKQEFLNFNPNMQSCPCWEVKFIVGSALTTSSVPILAMLIANANVFCTTAQGNSHVDSISLT